MVNFNVMILAEFLFRDLEIISEIQKRKEEDVKEIVREEMKNRHNCISGRNRRE